MEIEKVVKTVDKVDKTSRIAIVASILWLILMGINTHGREFVVLTILPVVAYWGYRFVRGAKS